MRRPTQRKYAAKAACGARSALFARNTAIKTPPSVDSALSWCYDVSKKKQFHRIKEPRSMIFCQTGCIRGTSEVEVACFMSNFLDVAGTEEEK